MNLANKPTVTRVLMIAPDSHEFTQLLPAILVELNCQGQYLKWPVNAITLQDYKPFSLVIACIDGIAEQDLLNFCRQFRLIDELTPLLLTGAELSPELLTTLLEAGATDYYAWDLLRNYKLALARIQSYLKSFNLKANSELWHNSELTYQTLIEQQPDLVVKLDEAGRFLYLNPASCEQFNCRQQDLIGKEWLSIVAKEDQQLVQETLKKLAQRPYLAVVEHRLNTGATTSESHWIAWSGRSIVDETGNIKEIINVGRNITEAYQCEERIWQIMQSFGYMSRLTSMGEMTSVMAHELNQPLTAILSFSQASQRLLEKPKQDIESLQYALSRVVSNAELAANVIRRTRELVRRKHLKKCLISLNDLILEMEQVVKRDLRRHTINLYLKLATNLPCVPLDYSRIQQVLLNLIYNSAEAIQQSQSMQREITISTDLFDANHVAVTVVDSGPGISAELYEQLFDVFVTNKDQGLGIGLAVCRSLIEEHGGALWVEQSSITGACFRFTIPLLDQDFMNVN